MFLPTIAFMNQICSIILKPFILGVKKNGWDEGALSNVGQCKIITLYVLMTSVMW
jgi:hypothetical protein